MMIYEYYDIVGELTKKGIVIKEDIYDFIDSPNSDTYEKYFQFCQENLSEQCTDYNIQPAKFFFRESFEVNARAGLLNNYFVIAVNKGTIHTLYNFLYSQNKIFDLNELYEYKENQ